MQALHFAVFAAGLACADSASAQVAVSANDNKAVLENGVAKVVPTPAPTPSRS
jgi:hypothetical protein